MSRWNIEIPYRTRDDRLVDVLDACRELPPEDRAVTRQLVTDLVGEVTNAGELIDAIEAASPDERRAMLDRAREAEGLESTGRVEFKESHEALQASLRRVPHRDEQGRSLQACHANGCLNHPLDAAGGWAPHAAARWHCPEHEHLAAAGDMDPPPERYVLDMRTMSPRAVGEERERLEREERKREEEQAEREEQRRREWEAIERAKQRYDDQTVENVFGLNVRPLSWRIVRD